MITLTREEAQQILECMETAIKAGDWVVDGACDPDFILYMLRAKLSEPEPEPVAGYRWEEGRIPPSVTFTAPPQRKECLRCGKVNPAEIHTCTPMTKKNIQTSDKNA